MVAVLKMRYTGTIFFFFFFFFLIFGATSVFAHRLFVISVLYLLLHLLKNTWFLFVLSQHYLGHIGPISQTVAGQAYRPSKRFLRTIIHWNAL